MECPTDDFGAQQNARIVAAWSAALMAEFRAELDLFPPETDHRLVFEGWALQKIAGLQSAVMELAERLDDVEDQLDEVTARLDE